ncbi:hypothetical protein AX774_g232 [Zancudomyces culisetae]|uniref:UPF3 domain-containing protein n=1 Tax=Zancudomyces culisetae TaxID=1213189 RepID=A0A1R1PZ31_ZANCU|nr:hypothetical protein AX774_g232 [Zancudomyces culisetae]|eukprot:OMH86205.1 hypothetical protein AX774_g232 [Zancudomyces culisetae]
MESIGKDERSGKQKEKAVQKPGDGNERVKEKIKDESKSTRAKGDVNGPGKAQKPRKPGSSVKSEKKTSQKPYSSKGHGDSEQKSRLIEAENEGKVKGNKSKKEKSNVKDSEKKPKGGRVRAGKSKIKSAKRIKSKFKVIIRRLPPDLPEHIFWKSVENALLWYNKSDEGTVYEVKMRVSALQKEGAVDGNATGNIAEQKNENESVLDTELVAGADVDKKTGTNLDADEHNEQDIKLNKTSYISETQVISTQMYTSRNLAKLDQKPYYREYIQGKIQKRAQVEYAPYQKGLYSGKKYKDTLTNTIHSDPGFLSFISNIMNPQSTAMAAKSGTEEAVTHLSKALVSAEYGPVTNDAETPTSTALLDYIRKSKQKTKGHSSRLKNPKKGKNIHHGKQKSAVDSKDRNKDLTTKESTTKTTDMHKDKRNAVSAASQGEKSTERLHTKERNIPHTEKNKQASSGGKGHHHRRLTEAQKAFKASKVRIRYAARYNDRYIPCDD